MQRKRKRSKKVPGYRSNIFSVFLWLGPELPLNFGSTVQKPVPAGSSTLIYKDSQTYPNETYPNEMYPNETYPNETYPNKTYSKETYPNETYPNKIYPNKTHPNEMFSQETYLI